MEPKALTEFECSKKFKKIAERTTAFAKKEVRIAKVYSNLWNDYEKINEKIAESKKNLNSVLLVERKEMQMVDALKQIKEERLEELKKVKDEIKVMEEKIKALRENPFSERNKETFKNLLKMHMLQICTRTHISDKDPKFVQGFTANTDRAEIVPFKIDHGQKTKSEIEKALWENCLRSSSHAPQWYSFKTSME